MPARCLRPGCFGHINQTGDRGSLYRCSECSAEYILFEVQGGRSMCAVVVNVEKSNSSEERHMMNEFRKAIIRRHSQNILAEIKTAQRTTLIGTSIAMSTIIITWLALYFFAPQLIAHNPIWSSLVTALLSICVGVWTFKQNRKIASLEKDYAAAYLEQWKTSRNKPSGIAVTETTNKDIR